MLKATFSATIAAALLGSLVTLGAAPSMGAGLKSRSDATAKTCTGSGEKRRCLACVSGDGIKSCFWYSAPAKK